MIRLTINDSVRYVLVGKEYPLADLFAMQLRTRNLALALAALPVLAGCGGGGTAEPAATAFQSTTVSQAASFQPPNRTDISFDELRGLMAPDDPPFSTEMNAFRQSSQFHGVNQVSVHYESNDFPVLVSTEPIIRERQAKINSLPHTQAMNVVQDADVDRWDDPTDSNADGGGQVIRHQAALVMISPGGKVLELDINITPGQGIPAAVPIHRGDSLILKGAYIITDPVETSRIDNKHHNVIHWTHHSGGSHPGGHIIFKGVTYQ